MQQPAWQNVTPSRGYFLDTNLGVNPKIGGFYPPKWMVKIMENPIKMDDLGGKKTIFFETPICIIYTNPNFMHHFFFKGKSLRNDLT